MKLAREFYKLPFKFNASRLKEEIQQFSESDWTPHHESFEGNFAIPLISVGGEFNNDFKGTMKATPALYKCQYIQQIISSFGEVIGRSRLMRLDSGCEVPLHSDINYHWYKKVRIHIPIMTNDNVIFKCGEKSVNMAEGECWIFDSWKYHKVENNSSQTRVHLVVDIAGSSRFWDMVKKINRPTSNEPDMSEAKLIEYDNNSRVEIATEKYNFPIIMCPGEIEYLVHDLFSNIYSYQNNDKVSVDALKEILRNFIFDWQELWSLYECHKDGWQYYHLLREKTMQLASKFEKNIFIDPHTSAIKILAHLIIAPSMNTELYESVHNGDKYLQNASPKSEQIIHTGLSRNSPCYCGSGVKLKNCHGRLK